MTNAAKDSFTTLVPLEGSANNLLTVLPANPTSYTTVPAQPRVGQLLTYKFTGSGLSAADEVWIESAGSVCDKSALISAADLTYVTPLVLQTGSSVTMEVRYTNNGNSYDVRVCYRKASTGTVAKVQPVGSISSITPAVPSKFEMTPLVPIVSSSVSFTFSNSIDQTVLNLQQGDVKKFVSASDACSDASQAVDVTQTVVATDTVSVIFKASGTFRVCYKLSAGTWSSVTDGSTPPTALITVYPALPVLYNTTVEVPQGRMTFRMHFKEPATPISGSPDLSADDKFMIVKSSGGSTDTICRTASTNDIAATGTVVKLITGGAEATVRLDEGTYVACYMLQGYDYVAVPRDIGGYTLTVSAQQVFLQSILPSTVHAQQTFLVELSPKHSEDSLFLYGTGGTSAWCTDISSPTCRCPDPVERPSVAALPVSCCNGRWRVGGRTAGNYVMCLNATTLMGVVQVGPAVPKQATVSVSGARQGQPFELSFSNVTLLGAGSTVNVLNGVCVCSAYAAAPCSVVGQYTAQMTDENVTLDIPTGLDAGLYTVCFLNSGDANDQRPVSIVSSSGLDAQLKINEANPTRAVLPVGTVLRTMEKVDIVVTMMGFDTNDVLRVVPSGGTCGDVTDYAVYHGWASDKVALVTFTATGKFILCYKRASEDFFTQIPDPAVVTVNPPFPALIGTVPPAPLHPSVGQELDIMLNCADATDTCSATDQVLLVPVAVDCDSAVVMWTTNPPIGAGSVLEKIGDYYASDDIGLVNNKATVSILELNETGVFSICYKAESRNPLYFTKIGEIEVYARNPSAFVVTPPDPTERELDVQFSFTGEGLLAEDEVLLVPVDVPCYAYNSLSHPVTLVVTDGTKATWHLEVPLTDPSLNPMVPSGFSSSITTTKTVCYKRNGTRWSSAGSFEVGATNPSYFEIAPPRYGVPPSMCQGQTNCPHATVSQFTTVRFVFSSTNQPLTSSDVIKVIPYTIGVENQCLEATPAASSADVHYPVDSEVPLMCQQDCTLRQPVTFNIQGSYDVCYKLAGRTFSWMGRVTVSTPYVQSYTTPGVDAGHLWSTGEELTLSIIRSGNPLVFGVNNKVYLVDGGEPCLLSPAPTYPPRRSGLPLYLTTSSNEAQIIGIEGNYNLCMSYATRTLSGDTVIVETKVPGTLVIGPSSPAYFATTPMQIPPGNTASTIRFTAPGASGYGLDKATDAAILVTGSDCNDSSPIGISLVLQDDGSVYASWTDRADGSYSICYRRGELGAWSVVPRRVIPYVLISFGSLGKTTGAVVSDLTVTGGISQTHTNLTLGSFMDFNNPTVATVTYLPPSTDLTVTLWMYVDAPSTFTLANLSSLVSFGIINGELAVGATSLGTATPTQQWTFVQFVYTVADKSVRGRVDFGTMTGPLALSGPVEFLDAVDVVLFDGFVGKADDIRVYAEALQESQLDAVAQIGLSNGLGPDADGALALKVASAPGSFATARAVKTGGPVEFTFANDAATDPQLTAGDRVLVTDQPCASLSNTAGSHPTPTASGLDASYVLPAAPAAGPYNVCYKPLLGLWDAVGTLVVEPASPTGVNVSAEIFGGQQVVLQWEEDPSDTPLGPTDEVRLASDPDCQNKIEENVTSIRLRAPWVTSSTVVYLCYKRMSPPNHPLTGVWVNPASATTTIVPQMPTYVATPVTVPSLTQGQYLTLTGVGGFTADRIYITSSPASGVYYTDPCMAITPPDSDQVGDVVNSATITLPPKSEGFYRVCYLRRTGGAKVWGSLENLMEITAANPTGYLYSPNPAYQGQEVDVDFVYTGQLGGYIVVVPEGTGCEGAMGVVKATDTYVHQADSSGKFSVCWVGDGVWRTFDPFEILPPNPKSWEVSPLYPDTGQAIAITFTGDNLQGGSAKITDGPCSSDGNVSASLSVSNSFAVARWNGDSIFEGIYTVCFKLAGSVWTRPPGPDLIVGKNPWKWELVSGTTQRFGPGAEMDFTGADLQDTDKVFLVKEGSACADVNEVPAGTVTTELVKANLCPTEAEGSYTVCYKREAVYIEVPPVLVITAAPVISAETTLFPRVTEIITLQIATLSPSPTITVETSDSLGSCSFTATPLPYTVVPTTEPNTLEILTSLTTEGSFNVYIDGAAGVDPAGDPAVFVVSAAAPTMFTPIEIQTGAEVVFTFPDAPMEAATVFVSQTTDCTSPCLPPACSAPNMDAQGRFPSTEAVQIALPPSNATVCYQRNNGGWLPMPNPLEITESSVTALTTCPGSGVVMFGQIATLTVVGDTRLGDEVSLVYGDSCAGSDRFAAAIPQSGGDVTLPLKNAPHTATATYYVCYTTNGVSHNLSRVLGASGRVTVTYPAVTFSTVPGTIRVGQLNTEIVFSQAVVEAALFKGTDPSLCDETCATKTTAKLGIRTNSDAGFSVLGNVLSLMDINLPVYESGTYVVCYQSSNRGTLVYAGGVTIEGRDPQSYVAFPSVLHAGETVTITFTVKEILAGNTAALVPSTSECLSSIGRLAPSSQAADVSFTFPLPPSSSQTLYKVCYSDSRGWVEVTSPGLLTVRPSEPTSVSFTPTELIHGRRVGITVSGTDIGPGDAMVVINKGGSCSPPVKACPQCESTSTAGPPSLAGLPLVQGDYNLCYKLNQSVFYKVSVFDQNNVASDLVFTVKQANPSGYVTYPETPEGGQEVRLTLTADIRSNSADVVQIVLTDLGDVSDTVCGVGEVVASWTTDQGVVTGQEVAFTEFFPQYRNYPVYGVVCYKYEGVEWVSVPPYVSSEGDLVVLESPQPSGSALYPPPGRANVLNLELRVSTTEPLTIGDEVWMSTTGCAGDGVVFTSTNSGQWGAAQDEADIPVADNVPQGSFVVCYKNSTNDVAQVIPRRNLIVFEAQPSGFTLVPTNPRAGQYVRISYTAGSSASDKAIFPRLGSLSDQIQLTQCTDTTTVIGVTLDTTGGFTYVDQYFTEGVYEVCYRTAEGALSRVANNGQPTIRVDPPNPTGYTVTPSKVYAGNDMTLTFSGTGLSQADQVKIVIGDCWSADSTIVLQGGVQSASSTETTIAVPRRNAGTLTVCYKLSTDSVWAIVGAKDGLVVYPANPTSFTVFPAVPRVRQQVTLTINGGSDLTNADQVKIIEYGTSCTDAASPGFGTVEGSPVGGQWVIKQQLDPYASALEAFVGTVCYKMAAQGSNWVEVGYSDPTSRLEVYGPHPEDFITSPVDVYLGEMFVVTFTSSLQFVNGGEAKLVPVGSSCDAAPLVTLVSVDSQTFQPTYFPAGTTGLNLTVCYKLPSATYAALPSPLVVNPQPVKCGSVISPVDSQLVTVRKGMEVRLSLALQDDVDPTFTDPTEVKLVQWTDEPNCATAQSVTPTPTRVGTLLWETYIGYDTPSSLRLCWKDIDRNVWVAACASCVTSSCQISVHSANPASYTTSPAVLYEGQTFQMVFTGNQLRGGDSVSLHEATSGYSCSSQAVFSSSIDVFYTVTVSMQATGQYHVCYAVTGESGLVQMDTVLVISPFTECRVSPSGQVGQLVAVKTRGLTRVAPVLPTALPGYNQISLNGAKLGYSTTQGCASPVEVATDGGLFISKVFADSEVGTEWYACMEPSTGGWAAMCKVFIQRSPLLDTCTVPPSVLSGQYVTLTLGDISKSLVAVVRDDSGLTCATVPRVDFQDTTPSPDGEVAVLTSPLSQGGYFVCLLDVTLVDTIYSTKGCLFNVEPKAPDGVSLLRNCDHEGSKATVVVTFPKNHPLQILPDVNDTAAVVASTSSCRDPGTVLPVTLMTDPYSVEMPSLRLPQGTWDVCYKIYGGSWSNVGSFVIGAMQPDAYSVFPSTKRAGQTLQITFSPLQGELLAPGTDSVGYGRSPECTDVTEYSPVGGTANATVAMHMFGGWGMYYMCYKVGDCAAAALGVDIGQFHPTMCSVPDKARAGTGFVIGVNGPEAGFKSTDLVKLVPLSAMCTDEQAPATGTTELPATVSSLGVTVTVPFFRDTNPSSATTYKVCYKLTSETYTQINNTCTVTVFPRNPYSFTTLPGVPTARMTFNISFKGDTLLLGDRAYVTTRPCEGLALFFWLQMLCFVGINFIKSQERVG
eukprot:TRINITY_DN5684_c0_g2_i4.p1 TRINITY_DN5684_c0_g2~~TRINITY_DN5684_c0_g2_i4.p1  ORF type:complete len:4394 (+),score=1032.43 TRINITY_DN5684_c0_g2_i4:1051-13182(+)